MRDALAGTLALALGCLPACSLISGLDDLRFGGLPDASILPGADGSAPVTPDSALDTAARHEDGAIAPTPPSSWPLLPRPYVALPAALAPPSCDGIDLSLGVWVTTYGPPITEADDPTPGRHTTCGGVPANDTYWYQDPNVPPWRFTLDPETCATMMSWPSYSGSQSFDVEGYWTSPEGGYGLWIDSISSTSGSTPCRVVRHATWRVATE